MSVDDRLTRASRSLRSEATWSAGELSLDAYRRRKGRRVALVTGSAVMVLVIGVTISVLLLTPAEEEATADDPAVLPTVSSTTTTTRPTSTSGVTPTTQPGGAVDVSGSARVVTGAGWVELHDAPVAGRHRTTSVWTGTHLFVWGGHLTESQEEPVPVAFEQDGYLFEPVTGEWEHLVPPEGLVCDFGRAHAVWADGVIVLIGRRQHQVPPCYDSVAYNVAGEEWIPLEGEFFDRVELLPTLETPVAWTGELLVAPVTGLAYDLAAGETIEMPEVEIPWPGAQSPLRVFWTGSEVVMAGNGAVAWQPGDDEWVRYPPTVPGLTGDHVWAGDRLWAVNYGMATASFDLTTGEWTQHDSLPLRFFECVPEPIDVGGLPAVRMCSGIALWEEDADPGWVPVPLEDVGASPWGELVGASDAIYSIGDPVLRFDIERTTEGSIVLPPTIPIGVMQLDVPEGWVFVRSFGRDQPLDGTTAADETIGVVFRSAQGIECTVTSTYGFGGTPQGFSEIGSISVDRPGRSMMEGTAFRGDDGSLLFTFPDDNGSDVVGIECAGTDAILSEHATVLARGLWSPWEEGVETEVHWASYYLDEAGLGFQVPAGGPSNWHFSTAHGRLTVATFPITAGSGDCHPIPGEALEDLGRSDALVAVSVEPAAFGAAFRPDAFGYGLFDRHGSGEIVDCLRRPDRGSLYVRTVVLGDNGVTFRVTIALGAEADETKRSQVLGILNRLRFDSPGWFAVVRCCDWPSPAVHLQIPAEGWQVADAPLTGSSNLELYSVGTFELRSGGDMCPHFPEFAYEDMGRTDAFVTIQQGPADAQGVPPRPESFDDTMGGPLDIPFCLSRPDADELFIRFIPFRDGGRTIYAFVGIGPEASEQRQAEVFEILDRLALAVVGGRSYGPAAP